MSEAPNYGIMAEMNEAMAATAGAEHRKERNPVRATALAKLRAGLVTTAEALRDLERIEVGE